MSEAIETLLKDIGHVTNETVDGQVTKRATRYYTFVERQNHEEELKRVDDQLKAPAFVQAGLSAEGRAHLMKRQRDLKRELAKCTPPVLTGEQKDALNVRRKELETDIRVGMPTQEQMRRNPVGAVDQHRRWERRTGSAILEWKNIRRALEPDSEDRDLANVEILRSSSLPTNGTSTFMADAQIPGHFAMTPVAKENWPLGEPKVDTPLKQAEKRERTEAQKAATLRAQAARRAKKAPVVEAPTEAKLLAENFL